MAKRPSITQVNLGEATLPLNNNFQRIAEQFDNTISRDGSTPNEMNADLDMNSNDILNVGNLYADNLWLDGQLMPSVPDIYQAVDDAREAAQEALGAAADANAAAGQAEDIKEEVEQLIEGLVSVTSKRSVDTFTGNGVLTTFTLQEPVADKDFTQVFIDGVYQSKAGYTTSGNTITLSEPLPAGAVLEVNSLEQNVVGTTSSDYISYGGTNVTDALDDLYSQAGGSVTPADVTAALNAREALLDLKYAPKPFIQTAKAPLSTDGRTLFAAKRAIARAKNDVAGSQLRMTTLGDSYSYLPEIPEAFAKMFEKTVSPVLRGFIPATTASNWYWNGESTSNSAGWTYQDASTPDITWPYGAGVDGHVLYTSGNSQTFTVNGLFASTFTVYTGAFGGTWRWRLNGGAWTSVSDGIGGGINATVIPSSGTNTFELSTVGNTGVVAFYGIRNNSGRRVTINKCGNGGMTGRRFSNYFSLSQTMLAHFQHDLILFNMGTNDYRTSGNPVDTTYVPALQDLVNVSRAATPNVGIVVIVPPQSDGVAQRPLSQYVDAAYQFCLQNDCEFLNLLDCFGPYTSSMWTDNLHLNQSGADMLAAQFNKQLFGLLNL